MFFSFVHVGVYGLCLVLGGSKYVAVATRLTVIRLNCMCLTVCVRPYRAVDPSLQQLRSCPTMWEIAVSHLVLFTHSMTAGVLRFDHLGFVNEKTYGTENMGASAEHES